MLTVYHEIYFQGESVYRLVIYPKNKSKLTHASVMKILIYTIVKRL